MSKRLNIAVVAPSGPVDRAAIQEGLDLFERDLSLLHPDCELEISTEFLEIDARPSFSYLQIDDSSQAKLFSEVLAASSIDFLWAARGGYGSSRWLPLLPWGQIGPDGPVFVGFSDITFIHSALSGFLGRGGIHGPMIQTYPETALDSRKALIDALAFERFPVMEGVEIWPGQAEAVVIGGNLTCICHTIGTPFEPEWDGRILILEEVNEVPYRIDRMLTHLKNAGIFERISGIVFGRFIFHESENSGRDTRFQNMVSNIIAERLSGYEMPVACGFDFGHGPGENYPIKLGGLYRLSISDGRATLSPLF